MKEININLEVKTMVTSHLGTGLRPCPRINVFQHPIFPEDITETGIYNYTFHLHEGGGRCGVDVFGWLFNEVEIKSDQPVFSKVAGENLDQIQHTINLTDAGTYDILVNIK